MGRQDREGRLASLGTFIVELRRRRVIRTLIAWGIVSFAVLQVAEPILHALHLPDGALTGVVVVLAAGFPVTAVLSWLFDIGPRGVERTASARGGDDTLARTTLAAPTRRGAVSDGPMPVLLRVARGEAEPAEARFGGTFVVGRSSGCDVRVRQPFVSRQHLRVEFDGERWWIEDLRTLSGTYVDGKAIRRIPLTGAVEVEVGQGGPRLSITPATPPAAG